MSPDSNHVITIITTSISPGPTPHPPLPAQKQIGNRSQISFKPLTIQVAILQLNFSSQFSKVHDPKSSEYLAIIPPFEELTTLVSAVRSDDSPETTQQYGQMIPLKQLAV